jgi:hypothetical protein
MEQLPENVRRYFEARADALTGDVRRVLGEGRELEQLPAPDDFDPLPAAVLEACGYYYVNVEQRDAGGPGPAPVTRLARTCATRRPLLPSPTC